MSEDLRLLHRAVWLRRVHALATRDCIDRADATLFERPLKSAHEEWRAADHGYFRPLLSDEIGESGGSRHHLFRGGKLVESDELLDGLLVGGLHHSFCNLFRGCGVLR